MNRLTVCEKIKVWKLFVKIKLESYLCRLSLNGISVYWVGKVYVYDIS